MNVDWCTQAQVATSRGFGCGRRNEHTWHVARGLALGAALLALSITFRALDGPLCAAWPIGTHFLWHLLNAAMLGWMIVVYHRHMVAGSGAGR